MEACDMCGINTDERSLTQVLGGLKFVCLSCNNDLIDIIEHFQGEIEDNTRIELNYVLSEDDLSRLTDLGFTGELEKNYITIWRNPDV